MINALSKFILIAASVLLVACSQESEPAVAKAAEPSAGELIVKKNCKVCHAQGINGAPVIGNSKMWASRSDQSVETLVSHAVEGYGLMPAKGGNMALTDEQITLAVEYMLSQLP